MITHDEFRELADRKSLICISIFIPTHRVSSPDTQKQDMLFLKNQLQKVEDILTRQKYDHRQIREILAPADTLLNESTFWSHLSDGLAIFLSENYARIYTVPVLFEAFSTVYNQFYVRPLLPLFSGDGRFFILTLQQREIKFYEATRHTITPVGVSDLVPGRIEDVVGYDFEQNVLQFRSQGSGNRAAIFHGHGGGDRDQKQEIEDFFREVDDGLMQMLHDENAPLVVACQEHYYPLYNKINSYPQLLDSHISRDPKTLDDMLLHELAWNLVAPEFDSERKQKIAAFNQALGSPKATSDVSEILASAFDGKTDTLFLENRADIWGVFDAKQRKARIAESHSDPNVSLTNLAAVQTFMQGGQVYLIEPDVMPFTDSKMLALFRY